MRGVFALVALLFALSFLDGGSAKKIPRWWLKVAQRQGPNACVVEEIPGTNKEFWTECRYWLNRKICGKKTRIRFECCEGFDQLEGEDGCTLVKPLKNLLETAESLGATKWASYIRESGLQNELESAGAYTLFAPTNDAFDAIKGSLRSQIDSYRGNPSNPVLLYHIVPSKLRSEDFDGDQTIETRHQGHNIRINKYSNGMTTINCALLIRKDQEASNGIVHIIDGVLDPSVGISNNVADMVLNDGRFKVLAEMLEKSGYINVLRTLQDSISIIAPSDEAFQKLPDSRREKIINDREARLALLQNHIIPHVICESAITGEHRVRTMSSNKLTFNCDIDGTYVESTKLRGNFNLGKNGIIHMIDDVLLPDRAKNLVELAESRQLVTFVQFVKRSGLEDTLSHTGDYTFFVPDETAWLEMPPEAMERANRDPEFAGLMLRFHGAYGRHLTNAITDNQAIMSLDEENPVRLQVWRRALGVEDAKITESDIEAQNGVIHIINKVIFPSNRSVEDILNSIRGYSFQSFLTILKRVTAQDPTVLNLGPGEDRFYTFFVPTDRAFSNVNRDDFARMNQDNSQLTKLVTNHVAVNMFPETSFESGLVYSIDGIGSNFNIKKNPSGKLTVNDAGVISSHMSANGVIHVIDKVFMPDLNTVSTIKRTSISTITSRHGGSSSSSSSSSSSRTFSTSRKSSGKSHHRGVTTNEDFEKDLETILPAYPQGSVMVGSIQREPETASSALEGKTTPRRESLYNTTTTTVVPQITRAYGISNNKDYESVHQLSESKEPHGHVVHVVRGNRVRNVVPKVHLSHNRGTHESNHSAVINIDYNPLIDNSKSVFRQYSKSYHENGNDLGIDNAQTFEKSAVPSLTTYDREWDLPDTKPVNSSRSYNFEKHDKDVSHSKFPSTLVNNVDVAGARGSHSQHSKTYSYTYSSASGSEPPGSINLHGNQLNPDTSSNHLSSSSTVKRVNTVGPVSPGGGRFSYVGHPYGNDVVGHESQALPFSSPVSTFVTSNSSSATDVEEPVPFTIERGENKIHGVSTITHRKRVDVTRTVYTHPARSSSYLAKSNHVISFPIDKKPIPTTTSNGKPRSDLLSAYAFTGEERDFADGAEFSEVRLPSEEIITVEQAKILRRQWRKKRHHRRLNNRRGRKRGGKKGLKKQRKHEQ